MILHTMLIESLRQGIKRLRTLINRCVFSALNWKKQEVIFYCVLFSVISDFDLVDFLNYD